MLYGQMLSEEWLMSVNCTLSDDRTPLGVILLALSRNLQ